MNREEIIQKLNHQPIEDLLEYCSSVPKLYNKVSNLLYKEFHLQSAEISLLCTYICNEVMKNEQR